MGKNNLYLGLLVGCFLVAVLAFSQYSTVADASSINMDSARIAAGGYDVVSYRSGQEPLPGVPEFMVTHEGARYLFASQANMAAFSSRPAHFLPEFGGFCAYGVRMGQKLPTDPAEFTIHDDRLFLFLDHATKVMWHEDIKANVKVAESIWPELK